MAQATQSSAHPEKNGGEGQRHPLGIYLKIWLLLFVLSACSYLVDYFHLQGYLRWGLVVVFMLMKAGLIIAVFMHMRWERLALIYTILVPPFCLLILVGTLLAESDRTLNQRERYFDNAAPAAPLGCFNGGQGQHLTVTFKMGFSLPAGALHLRWASLSLLVQKKVTKETHPSRADRSFAAIALAARQFCGSAPWRVPAPTGLNRPSLAG